MTNAEKESVRRNAFSLALWDGATDEEAHKKADREVSDRGCKCREAGLRLIREHAALRPQGPEGK